MVKKKRCTSLQSGPKVRLWFLLVSLPLKLLKIASYRSWKAQVLCDLHDSKHVGFFIHVFSGGVRVGLHCQRYVLRPYAPGHPKSNETGTISKLVLFACLSLSSISYSSR